jgi:hypothetical protein
MYVLVVVMAVLCCFNIKWLPKMADNMHARCDLA